MKLRALADPLEVPNNVSFYYAREISPALTLTLTYGLIFPLGLAGFLLSLRRWRRHLLLMLYAVAALGGLMSTIILARFRLVLATVLVVYAGAGLCWLFARLRSLRLGSAAAFAGLLAGLAVLQHLVLPLPDLRLRSATAIYPTDYLVAAHIYVQDGQFDRALAEIQRLAARASERASFGELAREAALYEGEYRTLWANRLLAEGRVEEARQQVRQVEAVE